MFCLKFDTDNAAFADGDAPAEAARILCEVVSRLSQGSTGGPVHDINGNRVGEFWLKEGGR